MVVGLKRRRELRKREVKLKRGGTVGGIRGPIRDQYFSAGTQNFNLHPKLLGSLLSSFKTDMQQR
jgi:hypothetical protein